MKNLYTWTAQPAQRPVTVADLRAGRVKQKFTQVTANTAEEAAAAAEAGLDTIIGNAQNVEAVRAGSKTLFLTAALGLPTYPTESDVLRAAFRALDLGADAIMTARSMAVLSMLVREDIPVMGHLGFGSAQKHLGRRLRAIGKTADEVYELYQRCRRLEDAGAAWSRPR